jgi:superfamily I DNA/RNA helicase
MHVRCEGDDDRGVASILKRQRRNSLLLESGGDHNNTNNNSSIGARRALCFGDDAGAEDAVLVETTTNNTMIDDSSDTSWTKEQRAIFEYVATPGDLIHVNALAGCGKTTAIALLCNKIMQRDPRSRILYLVFGNRAKEEARNSNMFPKGGMMIETTHSFARRQFFGTAYFMNCIPIEDYDIDEITRALGLEHEVHSQVVDHGTTKRSKLAKTIARYIRKTLAKFEQSKDHCVNEKHVYWLATKPSATKRTAWRSSFTAPDYVEWAQRIFDSTRDKCIEIRDRNRRHGIPHDAYMKVAQLQGLSQNFDYIAIDEAQDLSSCQADLFWGSGNREGKAIYLFGDQWQMLYRFRGASDSFQRAAERSTKVFTLTGSFRFGKKIADAASCVLKLVEGQRLEGLCAEEDSIQGESSFQRGVVLCRSNNGMLSYLLHNAPTRWCFLEQKRRPPKVADWILSLEAFVWGEAETFRRSGEVFSDEDELKEFLDDSDDSELRKNFDLVRMLKKQETRISDFYAVIKESFRALQGTVKAFDGFILSTVHSAKGLEFDNVYIHSDFPFERILETEEILTRPRLIDEINMIYVAVTRCKKNLFLSGSAHQFLDSQHAFDILPSLSDSRLSNVSLESERSAWEGKWTRFDESHEPITAAAQIPWPVGSSSENPFSLDRNMTEEDQKSHVHKMLRRFHTDKFVPKYRTRMEKMDNDQLKLVHDNLKSFTSTAAEFLRFLRENESN